MIRQTATDTLTDRQAIRHLLDHTWGTLTVYDHTTGRTHSRRVRYQHTDRGGLTTYISDTPQLLEAIRHGGAVSLEVDRVSTGLGANVTAWVSAAVTAVRDLRVGRATQRLIKLRLSIKRLTSGCRESVAA